LKFGFADYDDFYKDLGTLSGKVSVDLSSANSRIHRELTLNEKAVIENVKSVVKKFKGKKNDREVQGFKDCHIRDGAALCQYFGWLEDQLLNKKNTEIDEFSGAEVLHDFRGSFDWSKGDSFETISSVGANAAIIHYSPSKDDNSPMDPNKIYLLDSGGHYWDGTTDTTRTVHITKPTDREREMYTRVLLGNLDVEKTIWPKGRRYGGTDFDAMARRWLWFVGKDYAHGTGHGVGHFSCVHEMPPYLGRASKLTDNVYENNMVVTNEPGYYEEGAFGIRIENQLVIEDKREGF
jgi:Xaa-Pro aminopeptidase